MSDQTDPMTTLQDYVERSTHWREGGATRHDAKLALGELVASIDWTERGLAEWRAQAQMQARRAEALAASTRIAVAHLQAVLHDRATYDEQKLANCAARDWLVSIGSDPQTAAASLHVPATSSPPLRSNPSLNGEPA